MYRCIVKFTGSESDESIDSIELTDETYLALLSRLDHKTLHTVFIHFEKKKGRDTDVYEEEITQEEQEIEQKEQEIHLNTPLVTCLSLLNEYLKHSQQNDKIDFDIRDTQGYTPLGVLLFGTVYIINSDSWFINHDDELESIYSYPSSYFQIFRRAKT